jgi:acetate kinase
MPARNPASTSRLILVVNAGSTTLKLSVVDEEAQSRSIDSFDDAHGISAVAHRIVHGGSRFRYPIVLDETTERELEAISELAPLHNAPALAEASRARAAVPDVPHVAVFDTAFHATMAPEASMYALPARWRDEWGIRRYGFHGLSVAWAAERVPVPRLVVCHLGGGCSVTAVRDGRSVDTTMGFTPLEGVPMATRSGSIDPGALLHVLRERLLTVEQLQHDLEHESGLKGLGGTHRVDNLEGTLARAVYVHRIAGAIAQMAASAGGLDALVFTAGVGERSPSVRHEICQRLGFLGIELDLDANAVAQPDAEIATEGSAVRVHVIHAREDVVAARAARSLLYGE